MSQNPNPALDFWYDFASTYSYVSAMRIEDLAQASGVAVNWKPFLLGPVFATQGLRDSPFNIYPIKGANMWRDMERICERQNIPLQRPDVFPAKSVLAAKVAIIGGIDGWISAYSRAVFTANFALNQDISNPGTLISILTKLGLNAGDVLERANGAEGAGLRQQTESAIKQGVFGAPSFQVGDELFWGNDRLEHAIDWAVSHG